MKNELKRVDIDMVGAVNLLILSFQYLSLIHAGLERVGVGA